MPKLAELSIDIQAVSSTLIELQLVGAVVNEIKDVKLINAGETSPAVRQSSSQSSGDPESSSLLRGWQVTGSLALGATIEVWLRSDKEPSWVLPISESLLGEIRNESMNLSGQMRTAKRMEVTAEGPKDVLMSTQFAENVGRLSAVDTNRREFGANHTLRLRANYTDDQPIEVAVRLCENSFKSTVLFDFDDVPIAPALQ